MPIEILMVEAESSLWESLLTYLWQLLLAFIPFAGIYLGFRQHANKILAEKVIEKEVGILYDALMKFIDYSDACGLYLSLTKTKLAYVTGEISRDKLSDKFNDQYSEACDALFKHLSSIKKSELLLRSIGADDAASAVEGYKSQTVVFRRKILDSQKNPDMPDADFSDGIDKQSLLNEVKQNISNFEQLRDQCLSQIAAKKDSLKSIK
ncbi:hypothetical protein EIK76_10650 [Rheinheimera mesophila]|uniref:Uncharacterized protein n=1 Tax=Rheinheimera mesophila TaxID=1547515 RepID=A0A3P3QJI3_9GAMM|nr:hypothetical protein [Rheinheimera mesophila]KKL02488.1 hypothetical protein SD53_04420 [Rheinheimera mesophila]RRJ21327.1 hypothetical protein EIK76_10650 [Rheinheimera mesophila]